MKGMMKKLMIAVCGLVVLAVGCVSVPKTVINGTIAGQPFSVTSPKDSEMNGLDVSVATNGTVSLHITSLKAQMNPEVITMTGDAQAKIISAVASGVSGALGTAGAAGLGTLLKP